MALSCRKKQNILEYIAVAGELEWDKTASVSNTLVHVIRTRSLIKGCLEKVVRDLKEWDNKQLVQDALEEIISVHHRYRNFAVYTQARARGIYCCTSLLIQFPGGSRIKPVPDSIHDKVSVRLTFSLLHKISLPITGPYAGSGPFLLQYPLPYDRSKAPSITSCSLPERW